MSFQMLFGLSESNFRKQSSRSHDKTQIRCTQKWLEFSQCIILIRDIKMCFFGVGCGRWRGSWKHKALVFYHQLLICKCFHFFRSHNETDLYSFTFFVCACITGSSFSSSSSLLPGALPLPCLPWGSARPWWTLLAPWRRRFRCRRSSHWTSTTKTGPRSAPTSAGYCPNCTAVQVQSPLPSAALGGAHEHHHPATAAAAAACASLSFRVLCKPDIFSIHLCQFDSSLLHFQMMVEGQQSEYELFRRNNVLRSAWGCHGPAKPFVRSGVDHGPPCVFSPQTRMRGSEVSVSLCCVREQAVNGPGHIISVSVLRTHALH